MTMPAVDDNALRAAEAKARADAEAAKKKADQMKRKLDDDLKARLSTAKKNIDDEYRNKEASNSKELEKITKSSKIIDGEKKKIDDQYQLDRQKMLEQVNSIKSKEQTDRDYAEEDRREIEAELEKVLDTRDLHDADAAESLRDLKMELERLKKVEIELERDAARAKKALTIDAEKEVDDLRRKIALAEQLRAELLDSAQPEGISEDEIDYQCDQLFRTAPIRFKARRGHPLDERIAQIIAEKDITIPVVHIKDYLYLIGSNRCTCELKQDNVIVRLGGGNERFDSYVPYNHRLFERNLVI